MCVLVTGAIAVLSRSLRVAHGLVPPLDRGHSSGGRLSHPEDGLGVRNIGHGQGIVDEARHVNVMWRGRRLEATSRGT